MASIINGVLRHLLTAGGTVLAAQGLSTSSEIEMAVGAVVTLASFGWSIWQKIQAKKAQ
jgi:hypothetical protein